MLNKITATMLALAGSVVDAEAKVTVTCLTNAGHLTRQHEPMMKEFNAMQDEIEVGYAAPAKKLRQHAFRLVSWSATNTLPDCALRPTISYPHWRTHWLNVARSWTWTSC